MAVMRAAALVSGGPRPMAVPTTHAGGEGGAAAHGAPDTPVCQALHPCISPVIHLASF